MDAEKFDSAYTSNRLRTFFHRNTRNNRAFYDALIRLIFCEIRIPIQHPARSQGDEWADIQLPLWSRYEKDLSATPRQILPPSVVRTLTAWMAARSAQRDFAKAREILAELFNDCQLTALYDTPSAIQATNARRQADHAHR